ncbi:MAG: hypothetical protein Q4D55_11375 [Eubacteriales bacterium]|nr:hypothetical protein [Eubacteriales bacterium]
MAEKAINKVLENPFANAGGRLRKAPRKQKTEMLVIVIGARADDEVYETAQSHIEKHGL